MKSSELDERLRGLGKPKSDRTPRGFGEHCPEYGFRPCGCEGTAMCKLCQKSNVHHTGKRKMMQETEGLSMEFDPKAK